MLRGNFMSIKCNIKATMNRAIVMSLSVILLNLFTSVIADTQAWFNDSKLVLVRAEVANQEDIIESAVVDNEVNPTKLIITKSAKCTSSPVIYFEVLGRPVHYIQHMNPVELTSERLVFEIPINVKVNLNEYYNRVKTDGVATGTINVRYLNNYISIPINISYTHEYLRAKYTAPSTDSGK
jgi:hypothetical protein